ncbi:MAG: hypothetical protein ABW328_00810, partial [Ilumatobacteraceae bacterium]
GASAPPARELAHEIVDTAEVNGKPVSDAVKTCMHQAIDDFQLTETELDGFGSLDEVAKKADDGQEQAITIMDRFQEELAACNTAG